MNRVSKKVLSSVYQCQNWRTLYSIHTHDAQTLVLVTDIHPPSMIHEGPTITQHKFAPLDRNHKHQLWLVAGPLVFSSTFSISISLLGLIYWWAEGIWGFLIIDWSDIFQAYIKFWHMHLSFTWHSVSHMEAIFYLQINNLI